MNGRFRPAIILDVVMHSPALSLGITVALSGATGRRD
jgi:hypothetical protein